VKYKRIGKGIYVLIPGKQIIKKKTKLPLSLLERTLICFTRLGDQPLNKMSWIIPLRPHYFRKTRGKKLIQNSNQLMLVRREIPTRSPSVIAEDNHPKDSLTFMIVSKTSKGKGTYLYLFRIPDEPNLCPVLTSICYKSKLEEEAQDIKEYSSEFCQYDELGNRLVSRERIKYPQY
jgi:hypothetical protein